MILHLDLDCYFVSAERTRSPYLKNRPVVVVKSSDRAIFASHDSSVVMTQRVGAFNGLFQHERHWSGFDPQQWREEFIDEHGRIHGIVIARNYECKPFGIKTGTPLSEAVRMCPDLVIVSGDHLYYQLLSGKLRDFLHTKIPVLEQYSIDEFWGDVGGWVEERDIEAFVRELQKEILERFDLPMSFGVSTAKWIAKLATDFNKPYGITIVPKDQIIDFVSPMGIDSFPGIGKALSKRLEGYGIKTLAQVLSSEVLLRSWGRIGEDLLDRIRGMDNEAINPHHERRSIGISRNFVAISDRDELLRRVIILARHLSHTILKLQVNPTTYYLKLKYTTGGRSHMSITIDRLFSETLMRSIVVNMVHKIDYYPNAAVHSISISASNFSSLHKAKTFSLLDMQEDMKQRQLSDHITILRDKYGVDIVRCGIEKK